MEPLSREELDDFIAMALAEDVGDGDVTANSCVPDWARLHAVMAAREEMVVAGVGLATEVFLKLDPRAQITLHAGDGARLQAGDPILEVKGSARALLTAERTALNTVQHLSGIATLTRRYVDAIEGTGATLLDTRKTIPGLRRLEKYAILMGGGANHRMGLYDAVLIKDNHIAVAGSVTSCVNAAKRAGQTKIQVECDTLDQVKEALEAGATSLLLDNMPPPVLREALAIVDGRIPTEASGGVNLQTIRAIAETGVTFISVGRLTQSAPAVDIGLDYRS